MWKQLNRAQVIGQFCRMWLVNFKVPIWLLHFWRTTTRYHVWDQDCCEVITTMHFSQKYMYAMEGLWTEGHNNSCHALTGAKHVMQVVLRYFISIHTHTHTHTRTHTHTHTTAHTQTQTHTHTKTNVTKNTQTKQYAHTNKRIPNQTRSNPHYTSPPSHNTYDILSK